MTGTADSATPSTEFTVAHRDFQLWCRVAGQGESQGKLPLLVLHGGPGASSDSLFALDALAEGRRVLYYDQLGGGRSDRPHDPALWSIDLFVEELSLVRRSLGLDRVHIFGHSWGGMLALEHALSGAPGIASLILANTTASVPRWARETAALVELLPEPHRRVLRQARAAGDWRGEAVAAALRVFGARHLFRGDPAAAPAGLHDPTQPGAEPPEVYSVLFGANELAPDGLLRAWDVSDRLGEITVPALVVAGRYDEVTPLLTAEMHRSIPYSEYALFEQSAHFPHLEEPARFLAVLSDFLTRVEAYL